MNSKLVFSIIISVYNRPHSIRRCLESCLSQTVSDFEIIVVDDGSTDNTVAVISEFTDPRIRLIRNTENQGMGFTLARATEDVRGRWVVRLDSDQSLRNIGLERFFELSLKIPPEVGNIGACYQWDDGRITPRILPNEALNYEGVVKWREEEGGSDYISCIRSDVFHEVHWSRRRGSVTGLFQYDLACHTNTLIVNEVLGIEYTDMPNSFHRADRIIKIQQRMRNALDQAMTYDEILVRHGHALETYSPRQLKNFLLKSAFNYFLADKKGLGIKRIVKALQLFPLSLYGWTVLFTGLLGPKFVKWAYLHKKAEWSY